MRIIDDSYLYHGNDTLRDDSHISSPTGWIARSPRDNIIYEVDELYSLSRVDPITLFEITDHTDNFFYPKIKVTPVATEGFLGGEKCAHPRKNLVPDIPQKKFQTCGLEIQKSQKIKLFEDFISKNAIRLNLSFNLYKYFVKMFWRDFFGGAFFLKTYIRVATGDTFLGGTKE